MDHKFIKKSHVQGILFNNGSDGLDEEKTKTN